MSAPVFAEALPELEDEGETGELQADSTKAIEMILTAARRDVIRFIIEPLSIICTNIELAVTRLFVIGTPFGTP